MKSAPNVTVDYKLILSFKVIIPNNENLNIYPEKYQILAKEYVTLNETDISDIKCEKCPELNGNISKKCFYKSQYIKRTSNVLIIFFREHILIGLIVKLKNY